MKRTQGFTLIELMIVIAILGVLMAIAIPAYQDYLSRARASEALLAAAPVKMGIAEFEISNDRWPSVLASAGYTFAQTTYVSSLTMAGAGGIITVTSTLTGCKTGTPTFVLTPATVSNGNVRWKCTASGGQTCAPASCR